MADKYRQERIERLLEELKYEIKRGMMDGEIDEHLTFRFIVPLSKNPPNDVVYCRFETRPAQWHYVDADAREPRLRIVK